MNKRNRFGYRILSSVAQSVLEWLSSRFNIEDIISQTFSVAVLGCLKAIFLTWRCGSGHASGESYRLSSLDLLWCLEAKINLNQTGSISILSATSFWARPAVSWNPSKKQGETVGGLGTCTASLNKNLSWGQFEGPMDGMCCLWDCGHGRTQPGSFLRSWWMWFHKTQSINFHRHSLLEIIHYPVKKP